MNVRLFSFLLRNRRVFLITTLLAIAALIVRSTLQHKKQGDFSANFPRESHSHLNTNNHGVVQQGKPLIVQKHPEPYLVQQGKPLDAQRHQEPHLVQQGKPPDAKKHTEPHLVQQGKPLDAQKHPEPHFEQQGKPPDRQKHTEPHLVQQGKPPDAQKHPQRVIYNRTPKCGSRSLIFLLRRLSARNRFRFCESRVYNDTRPSAELLRREADLIMSVPPPMVYERHIHFVDFARFGVDAAPVYINLIRDPIDMFVSNYHYVRFGDNANSIRIENVTRPGNRNLDVSDWVLKNPASATTQKALWKMVPFFCGQDKICASPSVQALEQAKANVREHYVAVGILEHFEATLMVFERLLSGHFAGALEEWGKMTSNIERTHTKNKKNLTDEAYAVLRHRFEMDLEYQFYEFALSEFHNLKIQLNIR